MIKNERIFSPSKYNDKTLPFFTKLKMNNNIFTINNKQKYCLDIKTNKINKSIFTKIKNNVLMTNTCNFRNDESKKKNLKNVFSDKKNYELNNNEYNNNFNSNFNDIYYYKNNDFPYRNKISHNITKSQRIFKFFIPKKENKERLEEHKPRFYRYSSSNICDDSNSKYDYNHNFLVNKSNNLINSNKMIKSAKTNLYNKDKNKLFSKNEQKNIKLHKTNYNTNTNNNSKENKEKLFNKKKFKIITSPQKLGQEKMGKIKKPKARPLSTRCNLNIPRGINSLDDLLDINEKNCVNSLSNQLTKYNIGKTLGKGAYAIVKVVTNKITNENYAAKIYDKSEIKDKIRKRCVNNEIELLKKISHKNIIKLIEVIELKDHILIIQELFIGISLSQYYKKYWKSEDLSKEKEKTYKTILLQIFEAIKYLHENNIAHLDIKLENILINRKLEIKIIDFGFGIYEPKKILNTFFCGTPNYMSPEIVLKRPYISTLSDIWSLGVLVFKLFCNEYPFKGLTEKDLYNSIKKGKYRIKCYVNYDIKKLINSMLILEPNKRLSCEQLLKNPWFSHKNNKQ